LIGRFLLNNLTKSRKKYIISDKEKQMAVRNFNDAEKQKLIQIISQGSQVLGEVEDLKGGLKDTVKAIAEELELKPALINKAISVAHKGNYQNIADEMDTLESILNTAGKL